MGQFSVRRLFGLRSSTIGNPRSQTNAGLRLELLEARDTPSTLHVGFSNGEFHHIQDAVLAANPGDTISVDPGNFAEQVVVNRNSQNVRLDNLRLIGSNQSSIIKLPSTAPSSQATAIVELSFAQNVTVDGFTIEGPGFGFGSIGFGIELDNGASAVISNNHITHIRDNPMSGAQNGVAILVGRASTGQTATATISHNTIDDYQKGGIVVSNAGSSAGIDHNTILGVGPTATIGQNGIQVSSGATATIDHNNVSGNIYTGTTYFATGILLYQPGAVTVTFNTISNNQVGVYDFLAAGTHIAHNQIDGNTQNGIILDTTTGAAVNHNSTNNNGSGHDGDGGIALYNSTSNTIDHNQCNNNNGDGIFVDSNSTGNSIHHNHMTGNTRWDAEDLSTGAGTAGTANFWDHNQGDQSNPTGLVH